MEIFQLAGMDSFTTFTVPLIVTEIKAKIKCDQTLLLVSYLHNSGGDLPKSN